MHPTQLREALSSHDADPETVMSRLKSKQRARRRRQQALSSLAAVAVVAVGATAWWSLSRQTLETTPTNSEVMGGSGFSGCLSLKEGITTADKDGVSYITARGTLTGRIGVDGYHFREMVLTDVRTIVGAKVRDGALAWTLVPDYLATPLPGALEGGPDGPLWGPGQTLIGLYAPKAVNIGPLGARISMIPVVGDTAIMTARGCWNSFTAFDLPTTPYTGPLTEIPGTGTYNRMARRELVAVPLKAVEDLAKKK